MNNRTIRKIMEMLYGRKCFLERLGYKIKGAKTTDKILSYHHIIPQGLGGETSIANGALLTRSNHDWFHKQPLHVQDELNKQFQELKLECKFARLVVRDDGTIDFEQLDDVLLEVPAPIKVYDNKTLTPDEIRKLKYIRNQKDYLER